MLVMQAAFGGPAGGSVALLGVPRTDNTAVYTDQTCRATGCTRTFRSSSSDAASALQPDSNPQSPSSDATGAQPRRTSDPGAAGSGNGAGGGDAEHVEIVVSFDPAHDTAASLTSVNSSGSGGSTMRLPPPGCGLAPPPILSPNYWSSASSLCHFPTTAKLTSTPAADSTKLPGLSQSVSSCSLNPPPPSSSLLKPSLLSNTPFGRQLSATSLFDRHHQLSASTSSSEFVRGRRSPADECRRRSPPTDSDDDDDNGAGGGCGGSVFWEDRGSESTPLLTQQARAGRRVDVPSSLICCTPPRHRHTPRPHVSLSPLACLTPSPGGSRSSTGVDVAEFCSPAARTSRTRHASLRRRSRKSALVNIKREKWQSIDLLDT